MKGLLTKDIHLLLRQKQLLLMMALILLLLSRNGLEFTLGYFILLSFALGNSTVGYDAEARGMLYLMTLPVSRKQYVVEKYMVTLIPAAVATGIAIAIRFAHAKLQGQPANFMELTFGCLGVFLLLSLVIAIFLPMELLGKEKAQLLMNIGAAVAGIVFFMLLKNETIMERMRAYVTTVTAGADKVGLGAGTAGIWLAVMASSMLCSMWIMKRKEF